MSTQDHGTSVFDLALGCPTRQSSGDPDGTRSGAATNGRHTGAFAFSTAEEKDPWWQVDLGAVLPIGRLRVWNRDDAGVNGAERARPMRVLLSRDGSSWETLWHSQAVFGAKSFGAPLVIETMLPAMARFVRLQVERTGFLHLDQVEAFLSLPPLSFGGIERLRITADGPMATVCMRHNSGFFSVCSTILETILRLHSWGIGTESVDTRATHSVSRDPDGPEDVHAALFGSPTAGSLPALEDRASTYGPFHASHCHWHYRALDFAAVTPFVRRHFTPMPEIAAIEERLLAEHGLDPDRLLALYYRGTDKSSEVQPTEVARFIAEAERILSAEPGLRVLVQTDQQQVRDAIAAHFGSRCVYFADLPVTTGEVGLHHDARDLRGEFGMTRFGMAQHFLAAVRIMARARHVITGTSNVGLWIALFRGSVERLRQFDAQQELIEA